MGIRDGHRPERPPSHVSLQQCEPGCVCRFGIGAGKSVGPNWRPSADCKSRHDQGNPFLHRRSNPLPYRDRRHLHVNRNSTQDALDLGGIGRGRSFLSMVGIPPTSGFFAKWYLVLGSIQTDNWAFVAVIVISSLLNAVYFFRILEQAYLAPETKGAQAVSSTSGTQHSDSPRSQEIPPSMLWPILFLAALILIVGIFNALVVTEVLRPALPVGL